MKKIFLYLGVVSSCFFTSCETEDTANVSDVTNYAVFELAGSDEVLLSKGDEYVEPGATATEAGDPVDVSTTISSGLFRGNAFDNTISDIYTVSYSAVNKDGFEASASRTLVVGESGDLETDLSGVYTSTIERNGVSGAATNDIHYVLIWKKSDGVYEISDGIGGYYMYGRGYGIAYAARPATIKVNGPNDFTPGPSFPVGAFGGTATITEFSTDPAAKTIDFTTDWDAGYIFKVHLEQVQL